MTPDQSPIELFRKAWIGHAEGAPTSFGGGWQPPAPPSLQGVPRDRRWVVIRTEASDLPALAEFSQLESLTLVGSMDRRVLDVVRRLTSLQYLSVNQPQEEHLAELAQLPGLRHLLCDSSKMRVFAVPAGFAQLETLHVAELNRPATLDSVGRLNSLRWLILGSGMGRSTKIDTLAPLTELVGLEFFAMIGLRPADGSLRPLAALRALRYLTLANVFPITEYAQLAAALPNTIGDFRTPWLRPPAPAAAGDQTACKRCRAFVPGMTIGSPSRRLCPQCDAARIAKHLTTWQDLVAAASRASNAAT